MSQLMGVKFLINLWKIVYKHIKIIEKLSLLKEMITQLVASLNILISKKITR